MAIRIVWVFLLFAPFMCLGTAAGSPSDSCDFLTCDANGDGHCDIDDTVYMIVYIFLFGPAPAPYETASADSNCDCQVDIDDVTYGIVFIFCEGREPCTCEEWQYLCGPLR